MPPKKGCASHGKENWMAIMRDGIKRYKLPLSFSLIIILFLVFGVMTVNGMVTLGRLTRTIYEHPLVVSNASLNAALNLTKMHRDMKDVVLAQDPAERDAALRAVTANEQQVYAQLNIVRGHILGWEGQALERDTRRLFDDWAPIRNKVVRLLRAGNTSEAIRITQTEGAAHVVKLESKMLQLTSYARNKANHFLQTAERSQVKLENVTTGLTIAGVTLSLVIAVAATYLVGQAERGLEDEKQKLEKALIEIKTLRGIIPICSHCKKIRDDAGLWKQIEDYIHAHSEAEFSHGICPSCVQKHYGKYLDGKDGDDDDGHAHEHRAEA